MLHLAEDGPGAALSRAFFPMLYRPGELAQSRPLAAPCDSRRSASLFRPLGALGSGPTGRTWEKPSQVQCCTWLKTAWEQLSPGRFSPCCIDPGNSHARALRSLPAIPDAPPACFRHWRRQATVPLAARDRKPSQVQCRTRPQTPRKQYSVRFQNKKHPISMGCFLFWNPATSYSPGRFQPCCFAHRARTTGNLTKYNVALG